MPTVKETLAEYGFAISREISCKVERFAKPEETYYFILDDVHKRFVICVENIFRECSFMQSFDYGDLIDYSLNTNSNEQVIEGNAGKVLFGAMVGNLIAGDKGAIVGGTMGASRARNIDTIYSDIRVSLFMNNLNCMRVDMHLLGQKTTAGTESFNRAVAFTQALEGMLKFIDHYNDTDGTESLSYVQCRYCQLYVSVGTHRCPNCDAIIDQNNICAITPASFPQSGEIIRPPQKSESECLSHATNVSIKETFKSCLSMILLIIFMILTIYVFFKYII